MRLPTWLIPYWIRGLFVRPPRWVLIVLGFIALGLLIWFVGPLIAIAGHVPLGGFWVRIAVIAIVFTAIGARHGWRWWRTRQRNRELVADLEQRPSATATKDDIAAADITAMEERATKALAMMREAKIGRRGEFVYELPWYVIIGPPGAGKTTALKNSGLDFPIAQEVGDAPVRGIGGTRTTEWWFTDRAVLIDTAGRYTTQDSDEAADAGAWRGLLDLLKKHRPRQPVTGVIVAISVTDLVGADESAAATHGKAVRQRINEVQTAFGIRVPVYVLITKMDLLAGFNEFFDDLSQGDREQVWGETAKLDPAKVDAGVPLDVGTAFDGLMARLDARVLMRMQAEQDMVRRGLVFGFPQQVASIRAPLAAMMATIGRTTKFEPAPLVRGFYFTSGTQFGRPIDRLLGALSSRFGLSLSSGRLEGAKGRSYFLADLLKRVVFAESALAGRDPAAERRQRLVKLTSIGAAAGVTALLAIAWAISYFRNAALIDRLETRAGVLQKSVAALPQGAVSDTDVMQLLEPLGQARALPFASTAAPADRSPGFSWGIGQAGTFRPQVDGAYHNLLNRQFLPRLLLGLEDQLTEASGATPSGSSGGGGEDRRPQIYALLRLYLMLGRAPGAPLDKAGILSALDDQWANALPGEDQQPAKAALHAHLQSLLDGPMLPPRLNATLIAGARERVASLGPGERVYAQMLADPALRALPPFAISDVPGVGTSRLFTRRSGKPLTVGIPGMFRHRAFFTSVVPAIGRYASQSANESWVTGEAGPASSPLSSEAGRIKDALLTTYLADFTKRWDEMIDDTIVSGERPMDERLQVAVRPPSPVKALFSAWGEETNLTPPSLKRGVNSSTARIGAIFSRTIYRGVQRADQVASAANSGTRSNDPPGPLDEVIEHFRWLREIMPASGPSPVDDALIALTAVGDTGTAARSAAGLGDPALQSDKRAGAMAATARLAQVAATMPPAAGALFKGFVTASTTQLNQDARASIKTQYGQQLYPECRAILAQGFPFNGSTHDVSIDDFSRLLRPSGLIDAFQQSSLAGQIDTSHGVWGLTQSGRALGLSPLAVRQFQNAARLREVFFKPGDIRPNVRMLIEPLKVEGDAQTVTLTVDGAPASFDRVNRRAVELRWPGVSPGVSLSVQHVGSAVPSVRNWPGDWGFLRMMREGRITNANRGGFVMTLNDAGVSVTVRVRMLNTVNPFLMRELATFQCPAGL